MVKIDLERNIALIEVSGTPTSAEIQDSIDELLRHPDHVDGMDEIWDFRKATMVSFREKELQNLATFIRERLPKLAQRTALVIAEDVDYGIGRMWMAHAENLNADQDRELFKNMEEAVEWLLSSRK